MSDDTPAVPAVIVTLMDGSQIAVHHYPWDVEVDWRRHPNHAWFPVAFVGGRVEVRPYADAPPCTRDVGRLDDERPPNFSVVQGGAA